MPQNRRARVHRQALRRLRPDQQRSEHWQAQTPRSVRARVRRVWPIRAVGVAALVTSALELAGIVLLLVLLPGAVADTRSYTTAPTCPQGTAAGACSTRVGGQA
ncbi:hypothetical protein [Kitasatospora azatica]|uniref:hypothetical protein n=1 Tax=Kitasatospora azatica TaxID=58347 RepID=UPI0005685511|nr:hypothetical protein [Kitasatospora azatica]